MAQTSHIKKRGSVYQAQLAVPLDLQAIMGRKTMDRSLRTKDPHEAKRRLPDVLKGWHQEFDNARLGITLAKEQRRPLTSAQMAAREYQTRLAFDAELRVADDRYAKFEVDPDYAREFRDGYSGLLSDAELARLVGDRMERYRLAGRHDALQGSQEWRSRAQDLCAAIYESLAREVERAEGEFTGKPSHPILVNAEPEPEVAPQGETIMEVFDRYARENAKGISTDTLTQARRDVKLFADATGNVPVTKITKKAVREWKALLMDYPVKAAEIAAFRGMTMKQIIKANEKIGKPTISAGTVNRYLSAVAAFCDWLVRNDYLDRNPVQGLFQLIDKLARKKSIFTSDQLNELFASPLFTGCATDDAWHESGTHRIRDHRYWLPLVMLYSGARPAEIAQLSIADVREEHGTWIMHITEEGDGKKSVKTKGSMRVVPVHSELVKLGFVAHRDNMAARGETRLFPLATRNSRGQMVADFSRDFGRYLTRLGIKSGRGLSLYSFRHGFVDALRRAEYLDTQFGFLIGHGAHSMTGQYGNLPQGMLRQRVEMIEAVAYHGLDLSIIS